MSTRPRRGPLSAAVLALALVLLVAAPAGAASNTKPYAVSVGDPVVQNATVTFTVTFTNETSQQQLGSANLTVPASLLPVKSVSVPAPGTTVPPLGQVVQLRNLGLPPAGVLKVQVATSLPCASTSQVWSVIAKQSNDFNGPPGNDLTLDTANSNLTTSVAGACTLRFVAQPANARVTKTITDTPYTLPPVGRPVTVEVVDGSGTRVTTSTAPITLTLAPVSGSGVLSGTTTVATQQGLASFADLSVGAAGTYTLVAQSPGLTSATSAQFRIDDVATVCTGGVGCSASLANPNTVYDVTAPPLGGNDAGVLALNSVPKLDCANYFELSQTGVQVDFFPDLASFGRTKTVVATIDKATMQTDPNNGANFLQMCFGAPPEFGPFATRPGTAGVQAGLNIGLLTDCGNPAVPPCVSKRNKTQAGQGVIEVLAPGGDQDPRYSP